MKQLELIARAERNTERVAIVDERGPHTYADLLGRSEQIARALGAGAGALEPMAPQISRGSRVAYLVPPGFDHVATQWGIWRVGAIAVPLSHAQAPAEWRYVVADTDTAAIVTDGEAIDAVRRAMSNLPVSVLDVQQLGSLSGTSRARLDLASPSPDAGALILYTSGTTGKPKGVVLTHANLDAQVRALVEAWAWTPDDRILHVLPLHHVHGIVNVLMCALWVGATCEMASRFDAESVWNAFAARRLTLFMAVPTIYSKLIAAWESAPDGAKRGWSEGCRALRLMVSGSAALPVRVLDQWRRVSGHVLLERYGMTEIGMALSNPLHGERRPGYVGTPLPGVQVRIVNEQGANVEPGTSGELEVKGPGVFKEYWRQPETTAAAFHDGWFRTGDVALEEQGCFRLLGRQSVDIIKSGGYKISALEIEEVLREHPGVAECAVVGIEDAEWGERAAVAVVCGMGSPLDLDALREWAGSRLARYKLPTRLVEVRELPRNAMGKVSKPAVKRLFEPLRRQTPGAHTTL